MTIATRTLNFRIVVIAIPFDCDSGAVANWSLPAAKRFKKERKSLLIDCDLARNRGSGTEVPQFFPNETVH